MFEWIRSRSRGPSPVGLAAGAVERVLLVNHWHDDNKGDSAITMATIALVQERWPEASITVVSMLGGNDPAYARAFRHVAAAHPDVEVVESLVPSLGSSGTRPGVVEGARWCVSLLFQAAATATGHPRGRLRRRLGNADRLVMVGGSNLFDTGRVGVFGTLRLLQCCLPAIAARRLGVPYVLLGHTLGPANTRLGRALLRRIVSRAERVFVREELSAAFVRETLGLELGERLVVAPDVAFALGRTDDPSVRGLFGSGHTAVTSAVLVPRSHPFHDSRLDDRLVAELIRLGQLALASGVVERVLVYPQCLGPTAIEDDREIARLVAEGDDRFQYVDLDLAPGEVAAMFSQARFVVAVRLHAVILALTVGTPIHAIEYFTNKTRGVLESVGLGDHWSTFESLDGKQALAAISRLIEQSERSGLVDVAATTALAVRDAGRSLP